MSFKTTYSAYTGAYCKLCAILVFLSAPTTFNVIFSQPLSGPNNVTGKEEIAAGKKSTPIINPDESFFLLMLTERQFRDLLNYKTKRAQIALQFVIVRGTLTLKAWPGRREEKFDRLHAVIMDTVKRVSLKKPADLIDLSIQRLMRKPGIKNIKRKLALPSDQVILFYPVIDTQGRLIYNIYVATEGGARNFSPQGSGQVNVAGESSAQTVESHGKSYSFNLLVIDASTNPSPPGRFSNTTLQLY